MNFVDISWDVLNSADHLYKWKQSSELWSMIYTKVWCVLLFFSLWLCPQLFCEFASYDCHSTSETTLKNWEIISHKSYINVNVNITNLVCNVYIDIYIGFMWYIFPIFQSTCITKLWSYFMGYTVWLSGLICSIWWPHWWIMNVNGNHCQNCTCYICISDKEFGNFIGLRMKSYSMASNLF